MSLYGFFFARDKFARSEIRLGLIQARKNISGNLAAAASTSAALKK
tara:strand:- start:1163 stop:1300 length:138 start_codon:yes stop_codon:yes gene_type:complete